MKNIFLLLFLFTGLIARAQQTFTVSGTVTDDKGSTLPGATIFLTNTRHVTVSDNNGKFYFNGLEAGNYELVVKMVGSMPFVQKVSLAGKDVVINARLKDDNIMLNTVTIKAVDPNRDKYLKLFTKYFIGESTHADQCKLINPGVIRFHYDKDTKVLSAGTDKLLTIENRGLGYTLNYLVTDFKFDEQHLTMSYTGYPYFVEMKGSESQLRHWAANRRAAYLGSLYHFFRSAYHNTAEAEGFSVYVLSDLAVRMKVTAVAPTPAAALFEPSGDVQQLKTAYNVRTGNDTTALFVFYKGGSEPFSFLKSGMYVRPPVKLPAAGQLTKLEPLTDNIQIDKNGRVNPGQGFLVSGYWGWTKIAELVPADYRLDEPAATASVLPVNPATAALTKQMDETTAKLAKHIANNPTEHIYLHLNKPRYSRADTIWFRAYTVKGDAHLLSNISGIAYAELISPHDSIVQRINLKLESGLASGSFELPMGLVPGSYRIRAYTNLMKNAGEETFYDRPVVIGNPLPPAVNTNLKPGKKDSKLITAITQAATAQPDIQFMPEGGTLVNGLQSIVAFKAVNPDGSAASVNGMLSDNNGNVVAAIATTHAGMGSFVFVPVSGKSYTAKLQFINGSTQNVNLPAAVNEGSVLSVGSLGKDSLQINITAKNLKDKEIYIVAQAGGKVCYTITGILTGKPFVAAIAKELFPSGIARFTLFSASGEPVAERVVFINRSDKLDVKLNMDKTSYAAADKVDMSIMAGIDRQPVMGSFSAAIINEDKVPADENAEPTIFSQFLLSNELHGRISDLGYYFKDQNEQTQKDLDLLMLTQGYRKLEWKQQLDTVKQILKYPAEDGLSISGIVTNLSGKPVAKAKVTVSFPFLHLAADTLTDVNGRFTVKDLDVIDKAHVIVKATPTSGQAKLLTDAPPLLTTPLPFFAATNTSAALQKSYLDEEQQFQKLKGIQLKEVTIKDRYDPEKNKPDLSISTNMNGPGHADQVVMGNNLGVCALLSTCLIGKVYSIRIKHDSIINEARGEKVDWKNGSVTPMAIYLNGAPIGSIDDVSPMDVYSIEVLTSLKYMSIYGTNSKGGIILITTKQGIPGYDRIPDQKALNINKYVFNGFYKARSFYQPKYEANDPAEQQRSAIYWQPDILTDKDGKANLQYTNAGKGNYRLVVEGIDGEGRLGRVVYRYTVE